MYVDDADEDDDVPLGQRVRRGYSLRAQANHLCGISWLQWAPTVRGDGTAWPRKMDPHRGL